MLTEGYHKGRLNMVELAKAISENGCRAFGLYPRKGAIQPGADADLVVIDLEQETTLGLDKKRGSSDYCIWEGVQVKGVPVMTFVRGRLVAQDGEIVAEDPGGIFIPHQRTTLAVRRY
jgi:dihydroorotase-like cyclic amidohydrolase